MGTKGKISFAAFTLGIFGVFTAIIFCALEMVEISSMVGAAAAVVCCVGCWFGFESWEETASEQPFFLLKWIRKLGKLVTKTPPVEKETES